MGQIRNFEVSNSNFCLFVALKEMFKQIYVGKIYLLISRFLGSYVYLQKKSCFETHNFLKRPLL